MPNHAECCPVCHGAGVFNVVIPQDCTAPTRIETKVCRACVGKGFVVVSDGRGTAEIRHLKEQNAKRLAAVRELVSDCLLTGEWSLDVRKITIEKLKAVWPAGLETLLGMLRENGINPESGIHQIAEERDRLQARVQELETDLEGQRLRADLAATMMAEDREAGKRWLDALRTDNARLREALEECCGVLDHVRDHLGICGPGDGGDRRADADDLWGINIAMDTARIALNHEPGKGDIAEAAIEYAHRLGLMAFIGSNPEKEKKDD